MACCCLCGSLRFPPVQKAYRAGSEWELRARKSGKLPLALPQRRDFPLPRPHVSVWLFLNKTLRLQPPTSSLHFPPTASHIFPHLKTKWSSFYKSIFCGSPHDTVCLADKSYVKTWTSASSHPEMSPWLHHVCSVPPLLLCTSGLSEASASSRFLACSYSLCCAPW